MARRATNAAFVRFVAEQRPALLGAAYLMFGTQERAEDVVEAALGQLYRGWPWPGARLEVLRTVLHCHPGRLVLPWRQGERVQLADVHAEQPASGIVADLAQLDDDSRRAVILARFVGLSPAETATVLGVPATQVAQRVDTAVEQLVGRDAEHRDETSLSDELEAAAREVPTDSQPVAVDAAVAALGHGRMLARRRLLRTASVAATAVVVVVLAVSRVAGSADVADPPASSAPAPATEPPTATAAPTPSARPTCDPRQPGCRRDVLRDWRSQMTAVTTSHLDPGHDYFTGASDDPDDLQASDDYWRTQQGALSLDVVRRGSGATQIHLQVATSRDYAVRCGQLTRQRCTRQNFLDGYTYSLTETTTATQGMEVQLFLLGTGVVTVVARNAARGPALDVTRPELMRLATDPRLRLPPA